MKIPTTVHADGAWQWANSHGVLEAAADNVLCSRIAKAAMSAQPGGDPIDHGLSLMAELRRQGFGLVYLGEPERISLEESPTVRN
jgi:hypothetical protein